MTISVQPNPLRREPVIGPGMVIRSKDNGALYLVLRVEKNLEIAPHKADFVGMILSPGYTGKVGDVTWLSSNGWAGFEFVSQNVTITY